MNTAPTSLRSFLLAQAHSRSVDILRSDASRRRREERDAREVAMRVRNAGAIFVGTHAPVSLGDIDAGTTVRAIYPFGAGGVPPCVTVHKKRIAS